MASTGSISNPPTRVDTNRWRPKLSGYRILALTSALAFGISKFLISDKMGKIVEFAFVFWSMLCVPCPIWVRVESVLKSQQSYLDGLCRGCCGVS